MQDIFVVVGEEWVGGGRGLSNRHLTLCGCRIHNMPCPIICCGSVLSLVQILFSFVFEYCMKMC